MDDAAPEARSFALLLARVQISKELSISLIQSSIVTRAIVTSLKTEIL